MTLHILHPLALEFFDARILRNRPVVVMYIDLPVFGRSFAVDWHIDTGEVIVSGVTGNVTIGGKQRQVCEWIGADAVDNLEIARVVEWVRQDEQCRDVVDTAIEARRMREARS